jgi:hypothetical protein
MADSEPRPDKDQGDLIAESLNLLFERYGKPPIAQVS